MKKLTLAVLSVMFFSFFAFSAYGGDKILEPKEVEQFAEQTALRDKADLLLTAAVAYDKAAYDFAKVTNNVVVNGNVKNLSRIADVSDNAFQNLIYGLNKFSENAFVIGKGKEINDKLKLLFEFEFGPDRSDEVFIKNVSNEGKGKVTIGAREVNYVVAPGLDETTQDEKEVHAVEALPTGEYKVYLGILYPGQESVVLEADPRTFSKVDGHLAHHNLCDAQKAWLMCSDSKCVPYSENKTVKK